MYIYIYIYIYTYNTYLFICLNLIWSLGLCGKWQAQGMMEQKSGALTLTQCDADTTWTPVQTVVVHPT